MIWLLLGLIAMFIVVQLVRSFSNRTPKSERNMDQILREEEAKRTFPPNA